MTLKPQAQKTKTIEPKTKDNTIKLKTKNKDDKAKETTVKTQKTKT